MPDTILVSGATGFIGTRLVAALSTAGHRVLRLTRRPRAAADIAWDPEAGRIDPNLLEGMDAVIHLAGEPIGHRWSDDRKHRILESRVKGTELLARTLASLARRPRVMVSGSAVGFYGDRGDEAVDESSDRGRGFLADVVVAWEHAADAARDAKIRVVHPRMGLVMGRDGGALERLLPIFQVGGGGRIGDGSQYMSWIALDDAIRALEFLLATTHIAGPANVVAPAPATNADFTSALGRVLHRPTIATVPEFAVKMAFGEMGEEMLLAGQRVMPQTLLQHGFTFRFPELEPALRHVLR